MLKEAFQELQAKLLEAVRHHYGPRLVSLVIYGSVARGTQRFDSDLDFLLIAENLPRGRLRRLEDFEKVKRDLLPLLSDLEGRGFRTSFSPVFKTPQEVLRGSPLFLDMSEEAIILLDKDDFFRQVLNRLKDRLVALGAKRIRRGNAWYWDLKPDFRAGEVFEL